eukprot:UN05100
MRFTLSHSHVVQHHSKKMMRIVSEDDSVMRP